MHINPDKVVKAERLFSVGSTFTTLTFVFILVVILRVLNPLGPPKKLPLMNGARFYEFTDLLARWRFAVNGRNLCKTGLAKASIFGLITDTGYQIVLHPKFAHEIRNNPILNPRKAFANLMHLDIPGFEATREFLREDGLLQNAIRTKLLKMLWHVSTALSDETTIVLRSEWTDNPEWHEISPTQSVTKIIAQVSSRVFLGDPICRDPEWLHIAVNYTIDIFQTSLLLSIVPNIFRRPVAHALPSCRRLRKYLRDATRIVQSIIDERHMAKAQALKEGMQPKRYFDAIECFEEAMCGEVYNPVYAQLTLSFVATHTTSDMLTQVLYDLAKREVLIHALRAEIKHVLPQGWNKFTVNHLRLMDNVMKESQRLKPLGFVSMRRVAEESLLLSDGTVIPEGSSIIVSSERQWDEAYYPNPETFDPYRFLKLRESPGHPTSAQFEASSPDNLSWGLGKHSCPGRFFASNEIKVVLCHILMKYDLKIIGEKPQPRCFGTTLVADPFATLAVRRRREEVAL